MTERDWLKDIEDCFPRIMLTALEEQFPPQRGAKPQRERKLRLFGCAACRRINHLLLNTELRELLEIVERQVDGGTAPRELGNTLRRARKVKLPEPATDEEWDPIYGAYDYAQRAVVSLGSSDYVKFVEFFVEELYGATVNDPDNPEEEHIYQKALLLDIFGNPFRPVAFEAAWRTSTVVALAKQMYESRDFGAMPILADALRDAGCEAAAILTHCRDPKQVHVRGCWVVDLVLDKA